MQGYNRAKRCSLPSLDFHGLKLPSSYNKSKLSLPSVAHTLKQHISKSFPSRRASLAATEMYNAKMSNGDLRRRKLADSGDLCTMHEEESENEDSVASSRATSLSGDVFGRMSVSESIGSDRTLAETSSLNRNNYDSVEDERIKLAKIQEQAKRRHSESILDKTKVFKLNFHDLADIIAFKTPGGKTITKRNVDSTKASDHQNVHSKDDMIGAGLGDFELDNLSKLSTSNQTLDEPCEVDSKLEPNDEEGNTLDETEDKKEISSETQIDDCTPNVEIHVENEIQNGKITQNF